MSSYWCAYIYIYLNKWKRSDSLYSRIQINNCIRNDGKRKLQFGKDCSYNYFRQELSMGDKVSGWKYDGNGIFT